MIQLSLWFKEEIEVASTNAKSIIHSYQSIDMVDEWKLVDVMQIDYREVGEMCCSAFLQDHQHKDH